MDWPAFLNQHNIPYVTRGPNVSHGNIGISCPFCGAADPSQHLGIDPTTDKWNCWRDDSHGGNKPHRLIMALIGCNYSQACVIVGKPYVEITNTFGQLLHAGEAFFDENDKLIQTGQSLKMPDNFRPIGKSYAAKRFVNYLVYTRGFKAKDVKALIDYYDLHYCLSGPFKDRLIIPVYMNGKLVTWQGRSIYALHMLRYKTLTTDKKLAQQQGSSIAIAAISHTLLDYNNLLQQGGHTLYVCEGVFDAMKVDFYGRDIGIRATCLFTKTISEPQINYLAALAKQFEHLDVLLDEGAEASAIEMAGKLVSLGAGYVLLPPGIEDPGSLSPSQVRRYLENGATTTKPVQTGFQRSS